MTVQPFILTSKAIRERRPYERVLVLSCSRSGNTRKLAGAVAEGVRTVQGAQCMVKSTSQVSREDFLACDALIAGSAVSFGGMASEMKKVFGEFAGVRKKN